MNPKFKVGDWVYVRKLPRYAHGTCAGMLNAIQSNTKIRIESIDETPFGGDYLPRFDFKLGSGWAIASDELTKGVKPIIVIQISDKSPIRSKTKKK